MDIDVDTEIPVSELHMTCLSVGRSSRDSVNKVNDLRPASLGSVPTGTHMSHWWWQGDEHGVHVIDLKHPFPHMQLYNAKFGCSGSNHICISRGEPAKLASAKATSPWNA